MDRLEARVRLLEGRIGNFLRLSSNEAFDMALQCEMIATDCGPFDPAYTHFIQRSSDWFAASLILEKREPRK